VASILQRAAESEQDVIAHPPPLISRRSILGLIALAAVAAAMCLLRMLITRDGGEVWLAWPEPNIAGFRATSMCVGLIVGCSLAVAGVMLQALLRNPLAEPFILGISSGAGLGVMAAMYLTYRLQGPTVGGDQRLVPAIIGALLAQAMVYALGQRRGWLDPVSLVLVGVIISAVCGAGIMFFQHLVDTGLRSEFTMWLMGHIPESVDRWVFRTAAAMAAIGAIVGVAMGRAMDAATLGDDEARSVGLAIGPLRLAMFTLAGALAAATVAIAGPIGFVGLIAPHAARLVLGPRHGVLVIGAALCGIALVVGSDVARQSIDLGAGRMPIGVFTALIGGPAFIVLLLSGRAQS
jgi:iron complex transport system permease protein